VQLVTSIRCLAQAGPVPSTGGGAHDLFLDPLDMPAPQGFDLAAKLEVPSDLLIVQDAKTVENQGLNSALGRLLAIVEDNPEIQSNENFRALQDQLEGTENRVATARMDYNNAVREYNAYIRRFPQVLTAKVIGAGSREYFEAEEGAAEAPKVEF